MKKNLFIVVVGIAAVMIGCNTKTSNLPDKEIVEVKSDEFEKAKVEVKIERLEREMFKFKSSEEVAAFLTKHPMLVKQYFEVPNAAHEVPFVNKLYQMYTNEALKEFYNDNEKFYGDFSDLTTEMNGMFSYLNYYYPEYYVPQINTIVTGFQFDRDFSFSDSLIVISIDYFLGNKARYRPQFFEYMLSRYNKSEMVPMMGLAISSKYNEFDEKDETMIAEMIHYGKAHYFLERIMPELPDSLNIQYTSEEMIETDKNLDVIWGHFIEKKLLFDVNHKTKQRYIGESPKVTVIGDKCPGRIGRWLGWQIVRKYMKENPTVTLPELMKDKKAAEIFKKSKFKIKAA
jgi:gliding motility-associated lipoprotein GldB